MDVRKKVVKIKIENNSSTYFAKDEIEGYSNKLDVDVKKIFNLSQISNQLYSSSIYEDLKNQYFFENYKTLIEKVIEIKVKTDASNQFIIEEINNLANVLKINPEDLVKYILKSNSWASLEKGNYKSFYSKSYKLEKEIFLNNIRDKIIFKTMKEKIISDYSKGFTYEEIKKISNNYNINIKDIIANILSIKTYSEKRIKKDHLYSSDYYKQFKENYLMEKQIQILTKIMLERVSKTSSYSFSNEEIKQLSKKFEINERDFIVFILGRSDQLYHDFKANRIKKMYSDKYLEIKKEHVLKRKELVSHLFNPNKKTYFKMEDIKKMSELTNVNSDDIILNYFDKTKKNLYNLKTNYRNRKKISYGEHKAGKLPNNYVKKNYKELKRIVTISVNKAFNYFGIEKDISKTLMDDIIQECIIYLMKSGNPYDKTILIKETDTVLESNHAKILYTKSYYRALTEISSFLKSKNIIGEVYENSIRKQGLQDDLNQVNLIDFISLISEDEITKKILLYFSNNLFSKESLLELEYLLNIDKEEILNRLKQIKSYLNKNKVLKKTLKQ